MNEIFMSKFICDVRELMSAGLIMKLSLGLFMFKVLKFEFLRFLCLLDLYQLNKLNVFDYEKEVSDVPSKITYSAYL